MTLVAVGAAAGCGGGSSGLSRQDLIAKGDALCTQGRRETRPAPTGGSLPLFAKYFDAVEKAATKTLDKFKKLKPRDSERKAFDAFLAGAEKRIKALREARDAANAGNVAGVRAAVGQAKLDTPGYRSAAQQVGFKVCGSGS